MMTEQQMRMMMEMFNTPLFKQGANEMLKAAQQQGMESVNKFWGVTTEKEIFPGAEKMMERMTEFYQTMGFVPQARVDEIMKENTTLKNENQMLRDTIRDLQHRFMAENGAKAQQAWQEVVEKQLEMSREVTKNFFDVLKQPSAKNDK